MDITTSEVNYSMKWDKYTIITTTEAVDFLSAMLDECGIEGIEIEDHVPLTSDELKGMFIDFPPELGENDGSSKVSFYLENGKDHTSLLEKVKEGIAQVSSYVNVGPGTVLSDQTEDVDWINNWKSFFHAFTIENILIKPTWESCTEQDEGKVVIEIDPGISFGTGKHETTRLCIEQLCKYIKSGDEVLDVGCGSGILSIAALKLGAGHVVGTDIDENCMKSARDNMEVNHLTYEQGDFYMGNLIDDKSLQQTVGNHCYDIVVANILADVIIPMAPVIPDRLKDGGIFITSGIIDFKEQDVRKAIENAGFHILSVQHLGEWVGITAQKESSCSRSL